MTERKNRRVDDARRDSGEPGGGAGRVDDVRGSGVYPASGPLPEGQAEVRAPAGWGQGERGPAGYEDHGGSELYSVRGESGGAREQRGGEDTGPARQHQHCADVMTDNPAFCLPNDTVERAAQLMRAENVGSLPVVDDPQRKRLIGIVTDRDIVMKVVSMGASPRETTVEAAMTRDPLACQPQDDLSRATQAMARHQVRRIPIVGDQRELLGMIAQADIATRVEQPRRTGEVVEEISEPKDRH